MANIIKPKRSNTASNVPTTSNLSSGELAVNMADQKVYINNGTSIIQVGAGKLSALVDVVITTPSNGQSLTYNGTNWINSTGGGSGTVTSASVVSANGFAGTVATATTTPAITLTTSITGLIKGNGTALSAAVSGTDYAPATSGGSILYGNGAGGFSAVTVGTGLSFTTGTLSATNAGTVTSVTGTAPIASTGGATPAISIAQATTSASGYLSSTDWNTFNGKQAALVSGTNIKTVNSTTILGTGDISVGVTSVSGTAPIVSSGGATPAISMAAATTSVSGYLTSTDWNTFNGKQAAGSYVTVGGALGTPSSGTLTNCTFPTLNQNTTGTAGGLTGTPAIGVGAVTCTTITASGAITSTGNVTAYFSDDRLKTRHGKIENALEKLQTLDGFYYTPNEVAQAFGYEAIQDVGVSAQSVQAIMPEIVVPAPIDENYLTVRYEKLVPLLIEAIKELSEQVNQLKNKG